MSPGSVGSARGSIRTDASHRSRVGGQSDSQMLETGKLSHATDVTVNGGAGGAASPCQATNSGMSPSRRHSAPLLRLIRMKPKAAASRRQRLPERRPCAGAAWERCNARRCGTGHRPGAVCSLMVSLTVSRGGSGARAFRELCLGRGFGFYKQLGCTYWQLPTGLLGPASQ